MVNKTSKMYWDELVSHWQVWIGALTSVVYILGYLNGLIFLRSIGFQSAPTEVYSIGSLFVWGLTFFTTSLIAPAFISVFVLILRHYGFFRNKKHSYIFAAGISLLIFLLLPIIAQINPAGFQLIPSSTWLDFGLWGVLAVRGAGFKWFFFSVFLRIFTTFSLCFIGYAIIKLINERLNVRSAMIFLVALCIWNVALLTGISANALDVTAGDAPGAYSQNPAILGSLITRTRICNVGSGAPEYGNGAFKTMGLLLNRRDGTYYFYPGIFAQESIDHSLSNSIVIVPENEVIVFISYNR